MLKKALINDAELLVNADILEILAKFNLQDATSITTHGDLWPSCREGISGFRG